MQQHCLECRQTSPNQNNFCQRTACPAEKSPWIFEPGEWIENLEIVRVVLIGSTATIYDARRNGQPVTLKVAHPGDYCRMHLRREAEFLRLQRSDRLAYVPLLLNPDGSSDQQKAAPLENEYTYGRVAIQGALIYFLVFAHIDGEPLRDLLTKRPQLSSQHAAWIAQSIASVIHEIHQLGYLHLTLSGESALVTFDRDNTPRLIVTDYGTLLHNRDQLSGEALNYTGTPYRAPGLDTGMAPNRQADTYSLAKLLAHMLIGYLPKDQQVSIPIKPEGDIAPIINSALAQQTEDIGVLRADLRRMFGEVPEPRSYRWLSSITTLKVTIALVGATFLVLVVLTAIVR